MLHAYYRDHEDKIRVTLRFAIIMQGKLVETEHDSGFLFAITHETKVEARSAYLRSSTGP